MMLRHVLPFVVSIPVFAFAACGGSTDSSSNNSAQPSGNGDDSGVTTTTTTDDAGAADNGPDPIDPSYPTKHPAIPLVDYQGGRILENPHLINITVDGDTMRADLEKFSGLITSTKWWDAVRAGYCDGSGTCVGQGDAGDPVHLAATDFPTTSFTDTSQGGATTLQPFIASLIDSGKLPAPTPNTLYALYFPSESYTVNLDGSTSCGEFLGYHGAFSYPGVAATGTAAAVAAGDVVYAIVPRCGAEPTITLAASHEYIEATTDPDLSTISYYMKDQLWSIAGGGEVGDLCVTQDNSDEYQESGFTVQRIWSNNAAKASHEPCVPAPAGDVYFNVAPATEQFPLKVGATKTIVLTAFSDAPTPNWTISGIDYAQQFGGTQTLQFAFDKTIVNNGTKVNMTITVVAAPPQEFQGAAFFSINSQSGSTQRGWPGAAIVSDGAP